VNLRCQFGALKPGIDWEEVEEEGLTVLLDFREETDPDMRRFKLLWVFSALYEHIKRRGRREYPLAITIDEFSAMAYKVAEGTNPLAELLDEFIQQYLRGQNIWFTAAHQSIEHIDDQVRNSLFSLGTYFFGRATLPDARLLATVLFKRDPMRVKHVHKVWGKEDPPPLMLGYSRFGYARSPGRYPDSHPWEPTFPYYVLDTEPGAYMSLEDQQEEAANLIADLGLFEFLCRPAISEGEVSHAVIPVSIANLDRDGETGEYQFPNYDRVARFRSALEAKDGIPAAAILKELESALPGAGDGHSPRQQPLQPPAPHVPADGKREDPASAHPSPRHHQRRRQIP
jgi:hypothetical protein